MEIFNLIILTIITFLIPSLRNYYYQCNGGEKVVKLSSRLEIYDFIKGIAIISVIIIHLSYIFREHDSNAEYFLNLINNIFRFAIPVFLICSGIFISNSRNRLKVFYKKRILDILLPYILLTVIIGIINKISYQGQLLNLLNGSALLPFYYIPVLFHLYLMYPLLSKWKDHKYFLFYCFLISFFSYIFPIIFPYKILEISFTYIFFFAFGMTKGYRVLEDKNNKKLMRNLFFVVSIFLLVCFFSNEKYYNCQYFYGPAIFYLFLYFKEDILKSKISKIITKFGKNSLWIFLMHYLIIQIVFAVVYALEYSVYFNFVNVLVISTILSYYISNLAKRGYVYFLKQIIYGK